MKNGFWKRAFSGLLACWLMLSSLPATFAATGEGTAYAASTAVSIVTQPQSVAVPEGAMATVKVTAKGDGLTYKWYFKDAGTTKYYLTTSFTGNTYSVAMTPARSGRYLYCVITDKYGNSIRTKTVSIRMQTPLSIATQPKSVAVPNGAKATVKVTAKGDGLTYKWYYKDAGTTKYYLTTSFTGNTYSIAMTPARSGRYLYCVITDKYGNTVRTKTVSIRMQTPLSIVTQPQSVKVWKGETATVSVSAKGDNLTYKWYYKDAGATKYYLTTSFTGNRYYVTMNNARNGRQIYCVIADKYGNTITTDTVTLAMKQVLTITDQPQTATLDEGERARFYLGAQGEGVRYQWQYSTDFGTTWENADAVTNAYVVVADATTHGRMVRCVVTDEDGNAITSQPASLLVESLLNLTITKQPQDVICSPNDKVALEVYVEGILPHYMWQYSNDGIHWVDMNVTQPVCTITADADAFGRMYRCKVWDDYGNVYASNAARIYNANTLILSQPKNWVGCEDGKAFFEIDVPDNVVSCQWQLSTNNGGRWVDGSINDPCYSTTATAAKNGWLYRCVVTDTNGNTEISDVVSLTLSDNFSIVEQPTDAIGNFGDKVVFTIQVGGSNVALDWQRSSDGKSWDSIFKSNGRISQTIQLYNVGQYYRCVATNQDGRTLTSNVVQLKTTVTGFYLYEGKRFYIKDNGHLASGLETINGDIYYFTEGGTMRTGLRTINGNTYYFDRTGPAAKGFTYVPERYSNFYFDENGIAATGWTEIDGNTHYFYEDGTMAWGVTQIGEGEYFFDQTTGAQTFGMVRVGLNDYMYFEEGQSTPYGGLKYVNGNLYYFAKDGRNRGVTQSELITVDEDTYYFDPITKQAVSGFVEYNSSLYYMGPDHKAVKNNFVTVDGKTYLMSASGMMRYGLITYKENRYYFDPATGAAVSGWMDLDGLKLYFDPATYAAVTGLHTIDGVKYSFTANGHLRVGVSEAEGVRYHFADLDESKTGFVEINNNVYYVYDDQTVAIGLVTINGKQYYFGSDGVMRTGFRSIGGVRYYFDPQTGAAVNGLMQMSNSYTYYFNGAAGFNVGLNRIDGDLYCLDSAGIVRYGRIKVDDKIYYFDPATGKALTGWQAISDSDGVVRKAYFDPATYTAVTGPNQIDGKWYYFDASGWARPGKRTINGVTCYFCSGTYEVYTGWFKNADGNHIYFDGINGLLKGPGLVTINGATYYLNSYGHRKTGLLTVNGKKMYFDPVTAQAVEGFVFIPNTSSVNGGKTYSFNALKQARYGLQTIDGNLFYFHNSAGNMLYELQTINKKKYCFDKQTGVRKQGLIYVSTNGTYYLFNDSSAGVATSTTTLNGVLYVCKSNGTLRTGYCAAATNGLGYAVYLDEKTGEQQLGLISFVNSSGKTVSCYFQKTGCLTSTAAVRQELQKALATNGWHTVKGLKYYVKNGAFLKGKKTVGGKTYYFSEKTGAMLTGLRRIGSNYYYFDPTTGAMKTGMVTISGKKYYFDPTTGAQKLGLTKVDGKLYYFMENGLLTGTVQIGDTQYQFQSNGQGKKIAAATKTPAPSQPDTAETWGTYDGAKCYYRTNGQRVTGLQIIDYKLYYFDKNGKMKTGLLTVGGARYYFTDSGAKSGKVQIGEKEYYFSPSSLKMLTGLRKIGSVYCYHVEDGTRQTGWVTLQSGDRFYIKNNGVLTGLHTIDGKKYYFDESGRMRTGVQRVTTATDTKITCLFGDDGVMVTGLVKDGTGLYYYHPTTGARTTGFITVDGNEYYFSPTTGCAVTGMHNIDGFYYYFDTATAQRKYGLQKVKGYLRYFTDDTAGKGYATGLTVIDGKTYYFSEVKGIALTGYYSLDGVRYYFDPVTCASVSGIYRRKDGIVFSFKEGGGINTGWVTVDEKSYFFYPATGDMAVGLASVGDYLYYFDPDKGALRNATITVGQVTYAFDENGHGTALGDSYLTAIINEGIENFKKGYGHEGDTEDGSNVTCSQLVTCVFETIGIDLTKRACRQYYSLFNGAYPSEVITDVNEAKAGDLIFFITTNCDHHERCDYWNEIHHVGIYLGDGKILESYDIYGDSYNNGPMIRDMSKNYWSSVPYYLIRIKGISD